MHPHIIFPQQSVSVPKPKGFPSKKLVLSPIQNKARWITERFKNLLDSAQLSTKPGFWPERTLVFETIGSVDNFYRALQGLHSYKFLLTELGGEIEPDEENYLTDDEGPSTDLLSTTLYFSMVNRTSLEKIESLWRAYKNDSNYKFPAGFSGLKHIFNQLKSVRFWDTEDRLNVSGLREDLQERIKYGEESIPIEIELWFHPELHARIHYEKQVIAEVQKIGGKVITRCEIEQIGYHAILGQIPSQCVTELLAGRYDNVDLVRCDSIMFFRPVGQCQVAIADQETSIELPEEQSLSNEGSPPVIAVLDGYPMANHQALKDRLIIEDPFNFSEHYASGETVHGTSMASLILHGDKVLKEAPLRRKIVMCPIMVPDNKDRYNQVRQEKISEDHLPLDLVHIIVRRLLKGTPDNPAIAPHVKIINISIGDHHRLFDDRMSPWARLLDWLSYTFNVLFVVSAGNHVDYIELEISTSEFNQLSHQERERLILQALQRNTGTRRLRSPAEGINVLSVGALHHDGCDDSSISHHQINPFVTEGMPSPLNPLSWGKMRSIKPEILMPGGRQTYQNRNRLFDTRNVILSPTFSPLPPGLLTAAPGNVSGKVNTYVYTAGTSNATALATRKLGQLTETLDDLEIAPRGNELNKKIEAVLLKALICHGAQPSDAFEILKDVICDNPKESRWKANLSRFVGYGAVSPERLFGCEDHQATLLRSGYIKSGEQHRFQLALPPSLSSKTVNRRLMVTLAWFSPITAQRAHYREAKCWYSIVNDLHDKTLGAHNRNYDGNMIKKGTVQHEVFYGERAGVFTADSLIEIDINCKIKNEELSDSLIPFALVVTLDTQDISIPIYREVKQGIDGVVEKIKSATIDAEIGKQSK
ncbi:MAG: S8 family peptidase [Cellvibrio sp.]|nr:S8 family peptidase [Cellvibrio sp.]